MAREDFEEGEELDERVVDIARVAKVTRGGRRFTFRTVVVVGDHKGQVGVGVGRARDVAGAIRKGMARARNNMVRVPMVGTTIPHEVLSSYGATKILLKPAAPGTGVLAGGAARAVLEACGIADVLTKSLGSANVLNMVRATMKALSQLKDIEEEARRRGKTVSELGYRWLARRG